MYNVNSINFLMKMLVYFKIVVFCLNLILLSCELSCVSYVYERAS